MTKTAPRFFTKLFSSTAVSFILMLLCFAMLGTIAGYAQLKTDAGFLKFKQDYISIPIWNAAFYTHVFSCFFCLLAGFTQFSDSILSNALKWHKALGRLYVYNILLINFPMGMVLAIYANGHWPSKLAFILLDLLWFIFTLKGVLYIRNGHVSKHREFMIRSYALTLSAISLRLWKQGFTHFSGVDPQLVYMLDAWLGFVPNLLIAEFIIRRRRRYLSLKANIT